MSAGKTKGHWPAGKRRNVPDAVAKPVIDSVLDLLAKHPHRGTVSRRALAAKLGVDQRTIGRWLAMTDTPPADMLARLRAWCRLNRRG